MATGGALVRHDVTRACAEDPLRVPLQFKLLATYLLVVGLVFVPAFAYVRSSLAVELLAGVARGHGLLSRPLSRNGLHQTNYCPHCWAAGGAPSVCWVAEHR